MDAVEQRAVPVGLEDVSEHPFLRGLKQAHLKALAACAMRVNFKPGEMILHEGDPANRFYLIIKGRVAVEAEADGMRATVQNIAAGDVLGWSWLFPPYYLHFDARAIEPTEALFLYGTRLRDMCEEDHELGYEMLKRIAKVVIERLVAAERRLIAARGP